MSRLKTPVRKNDEVIVIGGKDRGKRGRVLQVLPEKNRVLVEGVNVIKRHTRANPQRNIKGGIVEREVIEWTVRVVETADGPLIELNLLGRDRRCGCSRDPRRRLNRDRARSLHSHFE